jgi:ParB family chromosome partitioning protein
MTAETIAKIKLKGDVTPQCMSVDKIRVGTRHRKDMGDLDALAASMDALGLLHPVVVAPDGLLLCGERRVAAAKLLGWETIPVTIRSKP